MSHIGVDFDNTIACYDQAFHRVAVATGILPEGPIRSKAEVKQALHERGQYETWTRLQGLVYGAEIQRAHPFAHVKEFLRAASARGHTLSIVSHKTRVPVLGDPHDLHAAARGWLQSNGFWELHLSPEEVFFEETREAKIERIRALGCSIFIDDLPEVFLEPTFPPAVEQWLHAPAGASPAGPWRPFSSWREAMAWIP